VVGTEPYRVQPTAAGREVRPAETEIGQQPLVPVPLPSHSGSQEVRKRLVIDPVVRFVRAFLPLLDHGQILGQVPEGEVPVAVPQAQTSTDHLAGDGRTRGHQQSGHVADQVRVLPAQPGSQSVPKLPVDEPELALSAVTCQPADVLTYLVRFQAARHLSNQQLQVMPDGKVNIAFVGPVQAAGLTQAEVAREIAKKLEEADILINPKLQVTVLTVHRPTCRVLGAVGRPGEIFFKDGDTIMDGIAQAGSYQENAWLEKSTITHKGAVKTIPLDLRKMFAGDLSQNYQLQQGDNIYVPPSTYENQFYILGHVARPGLYPIKDNTSVLAALSLAGGATERGEVRSTCVVRGNPSNRKQVKCDLTRLFNKGDLSQDIKLQPGDVVIVPETKKPDWNKVSTLLGTIVNIGYLRRYGLF